MASGPGEERERRIFYSWQSDTPRKENRDVIEDAIEKAGKQARATWAPSDRPEVQIDTASSGVLGARQIADVIFERIRTTDAFIADVSLVVREGPRLMPNPNVLVELGYALGVLSEARIVLVVNTAFGRVEDLPFDIRGRLVLSYSMKPGEAPKESKNSLAKDLTEIVARILTLPRTTQDVRVSVEVRDIIRAMLDGRPDDSHRRTVLIATIRNFSDFPVRLVTIAYEYEDGSGGFTNPEHFATLASTTIPPRDSRNYSLPIETFDEVPKVARVVVTDSLDREFASPPGAVEAALAGLHERQNSAESDPE